MTVNLSMELLLMMIVNIVSCSLYVGGLIMSMKFFEKQLSALEAKVQYHNNVISRQFLQEESIRTCHKRVDELRDDIKDLRDEVIALHDKED